MGNTNVNVSDIDSPVEDFTPQGGSDEWSDQRLDPGGDGAAVLWPNVKNQTGLWSPDRFKQLFPYTTDTDYEKYKNTYQIAETNAQQAQESGLLDKYWGMMQEYVQSQPGYEAMSAFIPDYLQRLTKLQEGQMDPYTGQLTVDAPWQRDAMMGYLGNELFGGIDQRYDQLGGMFGSVKDAFLPAMDANYQETVVNPMQERLNRMGLSGSTPGMEMTAGAGKGYAIQRAQAGASMDQQYASQLMGVEQARQGAWGQGAGMMSNLLGADEGRQRANIGTEYQDWMAHQNDPYTRLGLAGQAMNTSAGALSSAAGQGIQAAEIPYAQGSAWDMMSAENQFMAPFMAMAGKPISSGGGKK